MPPKDKDPSKQNHHTNPSSQKINPIVRGPRTVMKSGPRLPQLEKALAQKRRPNTAKKKKKNQP